jgi:uncharacterized damage-inducible protein DinB
VKEILSQYAAYNVWANQLIMQLVLALSYEQQQQVVPSSFPGVYKTMLHMLDAESIWWQRIKLAEKIDRPSVGKGLTAKEGVEGLLAQSATWQQWLDNASVAAVEHVMAYRNSKKEEFKQPVYQVLLHLFNHQTYHRGQLVTMLRQLGVDKIPSTDFIEWSRKKA